MGVPETQSYQMGICILMFIYLDTLVMKRFGSLCPNMFLCFVYLSLGWLAVQHTYQ